MVAPSPASEADDGGQTLSSPFLSNKFERETFAFAENYQAKTPLPSISPALAMHVRLCVPAAIILTRPSPLRVPQRTNTRLAPPSFSHYNSFSPFFDLQNIFCHPEHRVPMQ